MVVQIVHNQMKLFNGNGDDFFVFGEVLSHQPVGFHISANHSFLFESF